MKRGGETAPGAWTALKDLAPKARGLYRTSSSAGPAGRRKSAPQAAFSADYIRKCCDWQRNNPPARASGTAKAPEPMPTAGRSGKPILFGGIAPLLNRSKGLFRYVDGL